MTLRLFPYTTLLPIILCHLLLLFSTLSFHLLLAKPKPTNPKFTLLPNQTEKNPNLNLLPASPYCLHYSATDDFCSSNSSINPIPLKIDLLDDRSRSIGQNLRLPSRFLSTSVTKHNNYMPVIIFLISKFSSLFSRTIC